MSVEKCTQDYFDRERQDWIYLREYLDSEAESLEQLNYARQILGGDINEYVEFERDEETGQDVVELRHTDWNGIDEAIKNYFEPLSIKKYASIDPYSNEVIDADDNIYYIWLCVGGPGVYIQIDTTAELVVNWGGDHLTRDFGRDMAEIILSFYGLE